MYKFSRNKEIDWDRMKQLTDQDIQKYKDSLAATDKLASVIDDRVDEIISLIHRLFGHRQKGDRPNWWYPNAFEGERGTIDFDTEWVDYILGKSCRLDSGVWDYGSAIPYEFLTMTDEQISDIIKDEIKRTNDKKEQSV